MNKLIIVDNHIIFRTGIKQVLSDGNWEIVDEVLNPKELIISINKYHPDIILLSIEMPITTLAETIKKINSNLSSIKILAYSSDDNPEIVGDLISMGVFGFFSKKITKDELLHALETIQYNKHYFTPAITERLLHQITVGTNSRNSVIEFAPIERQIISLISRQYTNQAIAQKLGLGKRTIESYRSRIMHKIGAPHIAALIEYAYKYALTEFNEQ